ncbi:MAG: HAD family hydrolase [Lachnospiraceae bacterium]|nr:HAD family hydrolase [Lachnospiraceae bacterium]
MKYDHIVFDIDGTLLNTEYAVLHSLRDALGRPNIPLKELEFVLGITGADALRILSVKDIPATLQLWLKNSHKYDDSITIFGGIEDLLHQLALLGCKMGIATSQTRAEFEANKILSRIRPYFKTVICSDDTTGHKPTPEPLFKYMELAKTSNDKVLYIGDSKYDSECAQNAGVAFALAGWGSHDLTIPANYYFRNPMEAAEMLKDCHAV